MSDLTHELIIYAQDDIYITYNRNMFIEKQIIDSYNLNSLVGGQNVQLLGVEHERQQTFINNESFYIINLYFVYNNNTQFHFRLTKKANGESLPWTCLFVMSYDNVK